MAHETELRFERRPLRASTEPAEGASARQSTKWFIGLALFVSLLALFTSLQLFQLTSEKISKRTLERAVAALTEIDPLLDRNYDDIEKRAAGAAPGETVTLRGYPIDIQLSPAEVEGASKDELRRLLLQRSADLMYEEGTAPLQSVSGGHGSVGRLSVAALTDRGLGFLTKAHHDTLAIVTFVLASVSVLLAVTLAMLCRGFGRLTGVGAVALAASVPVLLAGGAVWSYARVQSGAGSEYTQQEFLRIAQELSWIPLRDGIAMAALGAVFVFVGAVCASWADTRRRSP